MANPYAPPGFDDGGFVPPGAGGTGGAPLPWEVGEVLKIAWEIVKRQPILVVVVFGVYLVQNLPSVAINIVQTLRLVEPDSIAFSLVAVGAILAGAILGLFLQIGQLRMFVAAARGQPLDFAVLLSGMDRFLPFIGMSILVGLAVMVGALALCVGAVIVALGFMLSQYYLIDARQGVIESMQTSWRVTKGTRMNLFLFLLAGLGLMMAGICAFCVGMFVAMAIFMAGFAVIYLRSAGEAIVAGVAPPAGGAPAHAYAPQGMG
jgi:uncharacterized membrane protein